jgi:hypothetical protein
MATPSVARGRRSAPIHGAVADLGVSVATYPRYAQALRAVDYLADNRFPIDRDAIVGSDLSMVERVLDRLTTRRAALAGAGAGAWFGLLIGIMFGLFSERSWWAALATGVALGAAWGAVFGAIAHAGTRGLRDFVSRGSFAAGSYEVLVEPERAEQARAMLAHLPSDP